MRTLVATLAALILLIPAVTLAQDCNLLRQANKLELTDEQIAQLRTNSLAERKDMIQLRADLQKARLEMHELMTAEKLDKTKVIKKGDEMSALKAQMAKKRLEAKLNRLSVLTDDQRAKLRTNMMKRPFGRGGDGFRGRHDRRWPGGRGGDCPNYPGDGQGKRGGGGGFGYFDDDDEDVVAEDDIIIDDDLAEFDDF